MSFNKFSSWNMDNIIIVAGTNLMCTHAQLDWKQRGNDENIYHHHHNHKSSIFCVSLIDQHCCACDKRVSLEITFNMIEVHINLSFIFIESKLSAVDTGTGIISMVIIHTLCVFFFLSSENLNWNQFNFTKIYHHSGVCIKRNTHRQHVFGGLKINCWCEKHQNLDTQNSNFEWNCPLSRIFWANVSLLIYCLIYLPFSYYLDPYD